MDLTHPEYVLLGENRARVLHRLSVLADPASGRRIHELSGVASLRTTQRILNDLVEVGLVDVRQLGSGNAYSVNRAHVLWAPVEQILAVRGVTQTRIVEILEATLADHAVCTAVFGSYARGEGSADSDIDVLIVWGGDIDAEEAAGMLDDAAEGIRRLTGNQAQMFPVTTQELDELASNNDPFVESLRQDAVSLTGASIKSLLRGQNR